jgi:mono/diheme cytochrome c family protein
VTHAKTIPNGRIIAVRAVSCYVPDRDLVAFPLILASIILFGQSQPTSAAPASLIVSNASEERQFSPAELLARPDAISLNVTGDVYHGAISYHAVPLLALLQGLVDPKLDTLEARASDGFVSQLPMSLITGGGAVAWIAVEDPAKPWLPLRSKSQTAGPFYLIWQHPERLGVTREQWPYQIVHLSLVESPPHRWPQLALPTNLSADSPAQRGQALFLTDCLPCHRLKGGGAGDAGPDLGFPMSATRYLTDSGLRAIIRDPKSVRTWPEQRMSGFDRSDLSDADLEAIVSYMHVMAGEVSAVTGK